MNVSSINLGKQEFNLLKPCNITVTSQRSLRKEALAQCIGQLEKPQVIFWYVGTYGLKEEGVSYYRKRFSSILAKSNSACCWLYDLTDWKAFKDPSHTLGKVDSNLAVINALALQQLKTATASEFFKWLQNESKGALSYYLKETVLKRASIFAASAKQIPTSIKVGNVFNYSCPIVQDLYERDCAACYSAFQYLEGLYLVDHLIASQVKEKSPSINIVFALPNNEYIYYPESFEEDVRNVMITKWQEELKGKEVKIFFYFFKFGTEESQRPYNTGSKNIEALTQSQLIEPYLLKKLNQSLQ